MVPKRRGVLYFPIRTIGVPKLLLEGQCRKTI